MKTLITLALNMLLIAVVACAAPTDSATSINANPTVSAVSNGDVAPLDSAANVGQPAYQIPTITFHYSYHLDYHSCAFDPENGEWLPTPPESVTKHLSEVIAAVPRFQEEWDQNGPPLMQEAARVVGQHWPWREQHAALYLCQEKTTEWLAGSALPAQFAAWFYLEGPMGDLGQEPWPMVDFVEGVFHEFLHIYVSKTKAAPEGYVLVEDSPLATEYMKNGGNLVSASHLHLFALEYRVLTNLGRQDMIDSALALYDAHLPQYREAWDEMMKNPEGYLSELITVLNS